VACNGDGRGDGPKRAMDYLTCVRVFCKTAELGSFSKAAAGANLNTPSVSRYIKGLEDDLGVKLFRRSSRRIELTEAGRLFYEKSVALLKDVEETRRAVSDTTATLSGTLRIHAPSDFGRLYVSPSLPQFLTENPRLSVDLRMVGEESAFNPDFDVKIITEPTERSNYFLQKIAANRHVVCASPAYLSSLPTPRIPSDLADHNCLLQSTAESERWTFGSMRSSVVDEVRVSGNFRSNSVCAILDATTHGLGLARLPVWLVGPLVKNGTLIHLLISYDVTAPGAGIFGLYAERKSASNKVRVFLESLQRHIGRPPRWDKP
jgi:DNA-binding transcriptional LysR family regulator